MLEQMVFFSIAMWWAYTSNEYRVAGAPKTSIWRPLWDRFVSCRNDKIWVLTRLAR
jgi:hypothetical protein